MMWLSLIILLIAPIAQIVLLVLRVKGKTNLSIGWNSTIMMLAAFSLSFVSGSITGFELSAKGYHCGMPILGILFIGFFICFVIIPIIGAIGAFIWYVVYRNPTIFKKPEQHPFQNY